MTAYISNEEFHVVRKRFQKPHASPGSIILGIVEEIDASIVDDSNDTAEPLAPVKVSDCKPTTRSREMSGARC